MRRIIALVFLGAALAAWGASPLSFKGAEGASVGIVVTELASGREIVSHDASRLLIPASVTKCVTAATAVASLPADTRFTTTATAYGTLTDGVLHGNIRISGTGDPSLGSRHISGQPDFRRELTDWLRAAGVDSVAGTVITADTRPGLEGHGLYWLVEDLAWEYGAPLHALNYRDNSFSMTVDRRGVTKMSPYVEGLDVDVALTAGQADKVDAVYTPEGRLLLTGTLRNPTYTSRYALPSPSEQLRGDIIESLHAAGIGCSETDTEGGDTRAFAPLVHRSAPIDAMLGKMMEKSVNLYAEAVLRRIAGGIERPVNDALAAQTAYWQQRGIDLTDTRIVDGSGLAPVNRVSARTLSRILAAMATEKRYTSLFPRVGMEGTVKGLLTDTRLKGRLALKSGSMNGVLCYAGYKLGADNRPTHAVVVMVNGFTAPTREVRAAISRWLLATF